jgi:cell volume regulation protein A
MDVGRLIFIAGALLAVAITASLVAGRLRVPGLLLFLAVGMAVGSDGLGWIHFSDYELARAIGIVALALILYEGGLASGWSEIRPVIWPSIGLATIGTAVTAAATGLVASWVLNLSTLEGLLLGSIVASTDGAAVFAILRGSTLRRRVARTLEGEAGLNDPVAILFVIAFIELIKDPDRSVIGLVGRLAAEMSIGLAVGLAIGYGAALALQRVRLSSAGLYPVASLAAAALSFGGADVLHGSGFLAVYVTGLVIGSFPTPATRTIAAFHDGLGWVAQLVLFLTLGLLVFPAQLGDVAVQGIVVSLVLVLVARPLGTILGTAFTGFSTAERIALSWAGLRGGVPVVLATFPVIEHVPGSLEFFNIVFFTVVVSTLLQGTTFEWVARKLGVTTNEAALPAPLMEPLAVKRLGAEVADFLVRAGDAIDGMRVRELGLPRDALLTVIVRADQAVPPRGSTRVQAGDRLNLLIRQERSVEFRELLERWRHGPIGRERRPFAVPRSTILTSRPYAEIDGDPSRPKAIGGIDVVEQVRTRRDDPGALVLLDDGRYAFTGPVVGIGPRPSLQEAARRRLRAASTDDDRAWWREVIGALAAPQ